MSEGKLLSDLVGKRVVFERGENGKNFHKTTSGRVRVITANEHGGTVLFWIELEDSRDFDSELTAAPAPGVIVCHAIEGWGGDYRLRVER